jgi:hypothetical protein
MKGTLHKVDQRWMMVFIDQNEDFEFTNSVLIHPDSFWLSQLSKDTELIEGKIVDFDMEYLEGVGDVAKLIFIEKDEMVIEKESMQINEHILSIVNNIEKPEDLKMDKIRALEYLVINRTDDSEWAETLLGLELIKMVKSPIELYTKDFLDDIIKRINN